MAADLPPVSWLPEQWREVLLARGEPRYRALQIFRWIHARGVMDPLLMTDLPQALRVALRDELGLGPPLELDHVYPSADGARKLTVRLADGAVVETVLLPMSRSLTHSDADAAAVDDAEPDADGAESGLRRVTHCISSQVGCAMRCVFCASGRAGLVRHLGADEIVAQVLVGRATLQPTERLRNVLLMGMGEPLHNYEGTARAIRLLTHPEGLGLSPRRITVSTCGLAREIRRLGDDFGGEVGLAVSLHHARDERRAALVPIAKSHPLPELIRALRSYPLPRGRRLTVEYTLIADENDAPTDARELAVLLRGLRVKVNLIPLNPVDGCPLDPATPQRAMAFRAVLADAGLPCFIRRRRADDVSAACGQLALREGRDRRTTGERQRGEDRRRGTRGRHASRRPRRNAFRPRSS